MRYVKWGALPALLLGMGLAVAAAPSSDDKINARPATYAELGKLVRSQRGKVIVVDFWSTY
jgi:hypothetical protein